VVENGVTGLLVPPADVPALGAALARLVSDQQLRETLGAAAAAFVRPRFGVDGYLAAVTGLYDRLLAEAGIS
jgi:glycosyltransferase involved in cell wall biosynthesis